MSFDNSDSKGTEGICPGKEPREYDDPKNEGIEQEILAVARCHQNLGPSGIYTHLYTHPPKDVPKISQAQVNFVLAKHHLRGLCLPSLAASP